MLRLSVVTAAAALLSALAFGIPAAQAQAADKDCADFTNQGQAQDFFLTQGGPSQDPHRLDADGDGKACDSLPCPCYSGSTGFTSTQTTAPVRQRGRVSKVVDGDTIKVTLDGGATETVRLLGIDTPEVYSDAECGGRRASRSITAMLPVGTLVRLVSDTSQANKDRYGRLLRYVTKLANGVDVNRAQLSRGWARVYVYQHNPFNRVNHYRTAQQQAQAQRRGIWQAC